MKSVDSLSVFIPYTASLLLYFFLKGQIDLEILLTIVVVILLYFIALILIGIREEGKEAEIPVVISREEVSTESLEKAMRKAGYKPMRTNYGRLWLRAEGLREDRTRIKYVNIGDILNVLRREFEFFRELFGANKVRFHIYIPQDQPTSAAFMTGVVLGKLNHKRFLTYYEKDPSSDELTLPADGSSSASEAFEISFKLREEVCREFEMGGLKEALEKIIEERGLSKGNLPDTILIDLTPSPINPGALNDVSKGKYIIISLKKKRVLNPGEIGSLIKHFVPEVSNFIEYIGGKVKLALKAPHPVNIHLGFELRYSSGVILLHYDRDRGKYVEIPLSS